MKTIKRYGAKGQEFIMELQFDDYKNNLRYLEEYKELKKLPYLQSEEEQNKIDEIINEQIKKINKLKIELNI